MYTPKTVIKLNKFLNGESKFTYKQQQKNLSTNNQKLK